MVQQACVAEWPPRRPDIPRYDDPPIGAGLRLVEAPLVVATPERLRGYGRLVPTPDFCAIEIVRWPAPGSRPVDPDCGDEGGMTVGEFASAWRNGRLHGVNDAVGGAYVIGVASRPDAVDGGGPGRKVLLWHANYHPDGGQMFYPKRREPFVVPMALPGDDVRPEHFVNFWFDGTQGLCMHPGIWHEGVFACAEAGVFLDRQGAVHARVSCEFPREFGCLLVAELPLARPHD